MIFSRVREFRSTGAAVLWEWRIILSFDPIVTYNEGVCIGRLLALDTWSKRALRHLTSEKSDAKWSLHAEALDVYMGLSDIGVKWILHVHSVDLWPHATIPRDESRDLDT